MFPVAGSGAAGATGASINPIDYPVIDPSTGFTKVEPDAMTYASISYTGATGITTYTMSALGTGNQKYNFAGGDASWPRHHQLLKNSDGTQLTTADSFMMLVRLDNFTFPGNDDFQVAVGLCLDPTATNTNDFDGYGVGFRMSSGSSNRKGKIIQLVLSSGSVNGYNATGTDTAYGVITRTARRNAGLTVFGETSDADSANNAYSTNSTTQLAATTNWSLWLATSMSSSTGTITASESFAYRASYQIVELR